MAGPRRAVITPRVLLWILWLRARVYVLVTGIALISVVGISYGARIGTSNQQVAAVSSTAPTYHRTPSVDRWGTRTPLLATPTPTPSFTPTQTATPRRTPTPTKTTARPVATTTKPTTKAVTTTKAAQPAGKCRTQLSGLTANTRNLHNTLCSRFPQVTTYYGVRQDTIWEHPSGRALDIMVYNNTALGQEIANYLQANASELGIQHLIWNQRIWSAARSGEGWRRMGDRGSVTANHGDHIHALSAR